MTMPIEIENKRAKGLVDLFENFAARDLIRNLDVEMSAITFGNLVLPLSRNQSGKTKNCYICSPSSAYIDYAIEETRNFAQAPLLQMVLASLIGLCAPLVKACGLEDQVQINNWLFSTNPLPALNADLVVDIKTRLTKEHPGSAIIIRSLNEIADGNSIKALEAAGFRLLASRQIYMFSGSSDDGNHRRTINRDRRMREKNGYRQARHEEFTDPDFARCEALYNMLYLEKYSTLNPHYSLTFFKEMHASGLVKFSGVRNATGELDAMSGIFENANTITQPFVGYDTTRPQEFGLYRIAMSFGIEQALSHNQKFNMSSGAASFKRNRGAEPALEYMAVYNRHLSLKNRIATAIVQKILKYIGVPLIRRFEL